MFKISLIIILFLGMKSSLSQYRHRAPSYRPMMDTFSGPSNEVINGRPSAGAAPILNNALPLISDGNCPNFPIVSDFEVKRYIGRWFEIEKYPAPFQSGDCVTADYGVGSNCVITVANTEVVGNKLRTIFGSAVSAGDTRKASLIVDFGNEAIGFPGEDPNTANYNVVATDYDNYTVIYSCTPFMNKKIEFSWILGRTEMLSEKFLLDLKAWLNSKGIDPSKYVPTNQKNCIRRPKHH